MAKKVLRPFLFDEEVNEVLESAVKELGYKTANQYIVDLIMKDIQPKG